MATSPILDCKCGRNIFVKVNQLRQSQAGGVVEQVAGWRCFECGNEVNVMELLRLRQLKEKEEELKQLAAEVGDAKNEMGATQGPQARTGKEAGSGDKATRKDSVPDKPKSAYDL